MRLVILFILMVSIATSADGFDRYTAHGGPVKGLAFSPDQTLLVSTSFDYTAVLWNASDMTELTQLVGHTAAVNAASFSPDGRWLATGGDDSLVLLWRVSDLKNPSSRPKSIKLHGHTAKVVALEFSDDSSILASSSWDRKVGLWNVPTTTSLRFLTGHTGPVNAAQFSRDGESLYSAGSDGHIRLWNLSTGEYVRSIVKNGFGINVMHLSQELQVLAYGGSNGVMKSVSLDGARSNIDLWLGGPPVLAVSVDSASQKIAFGTAKGRVVIADVLGGEIQHDFKAVKGPIWAMQLAKGAKDLYFSGLDDWITRIPLDDFIVPHPLAVQDRRFNSDGPIDNGAKQFARKCSVCHSLTSSSKRRAGPTLYGVFGRKVGAVEGYPYSEDLLAMDLVWSESTIDLLFRDGPDVVTPGSKMPVQRINVEQDRADLINYLKHATVSK